MTKQSESLTRQAPASRKISDVCAYVHERIGIRCGGLRSDHGTKYVDHEFKPFADAPDQQIAKHPFEQLPTDSGTCRACGQTPSHKAHSNVQPAPAPDAGGEWSVHKNKRDIVTGGDKYVAFATTDEHAAQIAREHNAVTFALRSGANWTLLDWQNWLRFHAADHAPLSTLKSE